MRKLLLSTVFICTIALNAQVTNVIDTTALKTQVSKAYKDISSLSTLNAYFDFLGPAEIICPMINDKKTLSLWISKTYYDMVRRFAVDEKKSMMDKQMNSSYLKSEVRKAYLLKAKYYLEIHLGYNPSGISEEFVDDSIFKDLKNALKRVEKEIKK